MGKLFTNTVLLIISLFFLTNTEVLAQNLTEQAYQSIKELKEGVLVIRLESNVKKHVALKEAAEKSTKAKSKAKLEQYLHRSISETNSYNQEMVYAFTKVYNFSDVLFMYDTATVALKNGGQSGFFLNNSLEVDPSISLEGKKFYILRMGATDYNSTTNTDALVVMDTNLEDLQKPFPYYIKIRGLGHAIAQIFNSKGRSQRSAVNLANRFNTKFNKFYLRATGS